MENITVTTLSDGEAIVSPESTNERMVILSIVFSVIIFLTTCGNLLVILAVLLTRSLRKPTNYLVVNLAIADFCLGVSVLPFSATLDILGGFWPFGRIFCMVWAAIDVLYCTASINTLCAISIDRYIGVTRPLNYRQIINGKRALLMILTVWVVSFAVSIPALLGWRDDRVKNDTVCEVNDEIGYVFFSVTVSFYLPTIIVVIIYWKIFQITRQSIDEMMQNMVFTKQTDNNDSGKFLSPDDKLHQCTSETSLSSSDSLQSLSNSGSLCNEKKGKVATEMANLRQDSLQIKRIRKLKMELKAAKTLAKVVGAFICCWFPFFFLLPFGKVCSCEIPEIVFTLAFWLGYCNSLVNPFVYAYSCKTFREAFKRLLLCNTRCK